MSTPVVEQLLSRLDAEPHAVADRWRYSASAEGRGPKLREGVCVGRRGLAEEIAAFGATVTTPWCPSRGVVSSVDADEHIQ